MDVNTKPYCRPLHRAIVLELLNIVNTQKICSVVCVKQQGSTLGLARWPDACFKAVGPVWAIGFFNSTGPVGHWFHSPTDNLNNIGLFINVHFVTFDL